MACLNQPGCGENSDGPQYVRVTCTSLAKMILRGPYSAKKRSRLPTAGAKTERSPQNNVRHLSKNGQARRRPVGPSGSNTRVCLFCFQCPPAKKGEVGCLSFRNCCSTRRIEMIFSQNSSLRSGRVKDAAGNRGSSSLERLCRQEVSHRRLLARASPRVRDTALAPQRRCLPGYHPLYKDEPEVQCSLHRNWPYRSGRDRPR